MTGHSAELNELATALAEAQSKLPKMDLDGQGQVGTRKMKYATLGNVISKCREVLGEHGLSFVQTCEPSGEGTLALTTTLLHKSGQFISGTAVLPLSQSTPQGYGSALTYARRYSLSAVLGVASEDDLDGHEGAEPRQRQQPRQNAQQPAQEAAQRPQGQSSPYLRQTPAGADKGVWPWFAMKLKDLGLSQDDAKGLLSINSFHTDMGDKTFEQILAWVEKAKLERDKASIEHANAALNQTRLHERS